jgi:hypothetical protein
MDKSKWLPVFLEFLQNQAWRNSGLDTIHSKQDVLGETFYTLFGALEFWKIFRGWEKNKNKFYFLTFAR